MVGIISGEATGELVIGDIVRTDGDALTIVGTDVGIIVGETLVYMLGEGAGEDGAIEVIIGVSVGGCVGFIVLGVRVGTLVGIVLGCKVGAAVVEGAIDVGMVVGEFEGHGVVPLSAARWAIQAATSTIPVLRTNTLACAGSPVEESPKLHNERTLGMNCK